MRFPNQIFGLRQNRRYPQALNVLQEYLLKQKVPDIRLIRELYNTGAETDKIYQIIQEFSDDKNFTAGIIREHNHSAPTEISNKRVEIAQNPHFIAIRHNLADWIIPDIEDLAEIYGDYKNDVRALFGMYLELAEKSDFKHAVKRDGYSSATHVNWVGGTAFALEDSFIAAALGAFHDGIEDLLEFYGGIRGYDNFVKLRIPESVRQAAKQDTNHYAMILHNINSELDNDKKPQKFTKETLQRYLNSKNFVQSRRRRKYDELGPYVDIIRDTLEHPQVEVLDNPAIDFYEAMKWYTYPLYMHELALESKRAGNLLPLKIKGIDVSFNAEDMWHLDELFFIKNILKRQIYVNESYGINAGSKSLDRCIMEIAEDTLVAAEHVVASRMLSLQLTLENFKKGLDNLKKLAPVFYTNRPVQNVILDNTAELVLHNGYHNGNGHEILDKTHNSHA